MVIILKQAQMISKLNIFSFLFFITFVFCFPTKSLAQFGIKYNSDEALQSYTLIQDLFNTYLIDNCGEILNTWDLGGNAVEEHSKMLPNGNLLSSLGNEILERDFNGNIIKSTSISETNLFLSYEVIVLPNGNYLCVGRRVESYFDFELGFFDGCFRDIPTDVTYFENKGYDVQKYPQAAWEDCVLEIEPETGNIVWEWKVFDHVIQDRDPSAANFGDVSENPQLLDMDAVADIDWEFCETFMINGIDYNEELDQIILSIRKLSEVAIIDHSTTTEEAKGSTGGKYGKGGDILYRWGNPQNYSRGTESNRELYFQHNPNWIEYGEHKGKIMIFDNGLDSGEFSSSIEIIEPPIDGNGNYTLDAGAAFGPQNATKTYDKFNSDFDDYSDYTSGAIVLPNGNIYITLGKNFKLLELNPEGERVWEYSYDYKLGLPSSVLYIYRTEKYSIFDEAFSNANLVPDNTLEIPPSSYDCELFTSSILDPQSQFQVKLLNSSDNLLLKEIDGKPFKYECLNVTGQVVMRSENSLQAHKIIKNNYTPGFYFFRIFSEDKNHISVLKAFID